LCFKQSLTGHMWSPSFKFKTCRHHFEALLAITHLAPAPSITWFENYVRPLTFNTFLFIFSFFPIIFNNLLWVIMILISRQKLPFCLFLYFKSFLKKINFFYFFLCFKLIFFLVFLYYFDALMSKIIFKK